MNIMINIDASWNRDRKGRKIKICEKRKRF